MSILKKGFLWDMTALVDSGFLYAMLNRRDPHHDAVLRVVRDVRLPVVLPIPAATEVAYLLHKYVNVDAMASFVEGLATTRMDLVTPVAEDYTRTAQLLRRYADAPLDFVDALIIAIGERLGVVTILTVDRRHFQMVRPCHCSAFSLLP